jgi:hypothetical protein
MCGLLTTAEDGFCPELQSQVMTDGRSVSQSVSVGIEIVGTIGKLPVRWGALSDERTVVICRSHTQQYDSSICFQYVLTIYIFTCIVHGRIYIHYIQGLRLTVPKQPLSFTRDFLEINCFEINATLILKSTVSTAQSV